MHVILKCQGQGHCAKVRYQTAKQLPKCTCLDMGS